MNNTELPKRTLKQKIFALIIVVLIIYAGFSFSKYLIKTKPTAKKRPPAKTETFIKVVKAKKTDTNITVTAIGTVVPSEQIALKPQVSGKVIAVNSELIPGGLLRKGEIAVEIDKSDYQIVKSIKENNLVKVKADLEIEYGRQKVAKKEWNLLQKYMKNTDNETAYLALRKPQLKQKVSAIKIAEQELRQAKLNLIRTYVKVPFDAVVSEKNISVGTVVNTQTVLAKLTGIKKFWIIASVPNAYLEQLGLKFSSKRFNNKVFVYRLNENNGNNFRRGKIIKILSEVDEKGKMAKVLIEVEDPLSLNNKSKFPVLTGDTVRVVVEGKKLNDVYKIPVNLVYENNELFVYKDGKLKITPVDIVWKDMKYVYVKSGIKENDLIVTTNIPVPVDGMNLKILK